MSETRQHDARNEVPARRHALIFETYGRLPVGGVFELVNDHDPKPLYYQFAAEHAGEFSWGRRDGTEDVAGADRSPRGFDVGPYYFQPTMGLWPRW